MSAALLRNNKKYNELEDDRESCLHVLTWTALRFTEHTCSEGDSRYVKPESFGRIVRNCGWRQGRSQGGALKKGFLLGRNIARVVKFDRRPQLDAFMRELTQAFSLRYEEPP